MNNISMAFTLTTLAGLSTMLGLIIIFINIKNQNKIICASLSFASGVMICVSITDLIPESIKMLRESYKGPIIILISFIFILIGIIISTLIDKTIPTINTKTPKQGLFKIGIISMLAIIIHNIPEGIATFVSTTKDTSLGISLAIAIALHNIPEGISIGIPIYYSTNSKFKSFLYTFISALSEPFGAIITYLFLYQFITQSILGMLFSLIAGIMLQISICELIEEAKKYKLKNIFIPSFIIGILFMLLKFIL